MAQVPKECHGNNTTVEQVAREFTKKQTKFFKKLNRYAVNIPSTVVSRLWQRLHSYKFKNMRQFHLAFSNCNSLRSDLNWTHYRHLMRDENK